PERVPAERMQHLETLHPLHARQDVAHHVVARMPDGQVARRIRVHDQVVVLRLGRAVGSLHHPAFGPDLLPPGLDLLRYVGATAGAAGHGPQILGTQVRDPRWPRSEAPRRPPATSQTAAPPAGRRRPGPTPVRWRGSTPCGWRWSAPGPTSG